MIVCNSGTDCSAIRPPDGSEKSAAHSQQELRKLSAGSLSSAPNRAFDRVLFALTRLDVRRFVVSGTVADLAQQGLGCGSITSGTRSI